MLIKKSKSPKDKLDEKKQTAHHASKSPSTVSRESNLLPKMTNSENSYHWILATCQNALDIWRRTHVQSRMKARKTFIRGGSYNCIMARRSWTLTGVLSKSVLRWSNWFLVRWLFDLIEREFEMNRSCHRNLRRYLRCWYHYTSNFETRAAMVADCHSICQKFVIWRILESWRALAIPSRWNLFVGRCELLSFQISFASSMKFPLFGGLRSKEDVSVRKDNGVAFVCHCGEPDSIDQKILDFSSSFW